MEILHFDFLRSYQYLTVGEKPSEFGCAKCGACTTVCPLFKVTGREPLSARGKIHLLERLGPGRPSGRLAGILSRCLLCGACRSVCPRGIATPDLVVAARAQCPDSLKKWLVRHGLGQPELLRGAGQTLRTVNALLTDILPPESGLRLRLGRSGLPTWLSLPRGPGYIAGRGQPPTGNNSAESRTRFFSLSTDWRERAGGRGLSSTSYFVGCLANHLQPAIGQATEGLITLATGGRPAVTPDQTCCGLAAIAAGDADQARQLAIRNIKAFAGSSEPIVTSCAACYAQLRTYPELLGADRRWQQQAASFATRLRELTSFLADAEPLASRIAGATGPPQTIFYHDPCQIGRAHV